MINSRIARALSTITPTALSIVALSRALLPRYFCYAFGIKNASLQKTFGFIA